MSITGNSSAFHLIGCAILFAGLLALSGCDQSNSVTIHEPGVYQGATDDLITDKAQLQDRIKHQMDR